jgi:hypothetical protein
MWMCSSLSKSSFTDTGFACLDFSTASIEHIPRRASCVLPRLIAARNPSTALRKHVAKCLCCNVAYQSIGRERTSSDAPHRRVDAATSTPQGRFNLFFGL